MKKIGMILMLLIATSSFASSNITYLKERYKFNIASNIDATKNESERIFLGDRIEADAVLEMSEGGYDNYLSYELKGKILLPKSNEMILMMPRIDLLERHINTLAQTTKTIYVFLMENDKKFNEYGDRSYETYVAKGLEKRLPFNVKVFKLNTKVDTKYFAIDDIFNHPVFEEISNIHDGISKIKIAR